MTGDRPHSEAIGTRTVVVDLNGLPQIDLVLHLLRSMVETVDPHVRPVEVGIRMEEAGLNDLPHVGLVLRPHRPKFSKRVELAPRVEVGIRVERDAPHSSLRLDH
jgi:hypothetical protein